MTCNCGFNPVKGLQGLQGKRGEQGERGETGRGMQGLRGATGPIGPAGDAVNVDKKFDDVNNRVTTTDNKIATVNTELTETKKTVASITGEVGDINLRIEGTDNSINVLSNNIDQTNYQLVSTTNYVKNVAVSIAWYEHLVPNKEMSKNQWDWHLAIQAAINDASLNGGTVNVPFGKYGVSKAPKISASNIIFQGSSLGSEIVYLGSVYDSLKGTEGLAVLEVDGGTPISGVVIKDLTLQGGSSSLWGLYMKYAYGTVLDNVRIRRSIGFIRSEHCYNSSYNNILLEYSSSSKPVDMSSADWDLVRDKGAIFTTEGNGDRFGKIKVYGFGISEGSTARSLFYLHGSVMSIGDLTIERSNRFLEGKIVDGSPSINHLIWIAAGGNIDIDTIYLENTDMLSILTSTSANTHNVKISNVYVNKCFLYNYPFYFTAGKSYSVDNIFMIETTFNYGRAIVYNSSKDCSLNGEILWYSGIPKTINGKTYADTETIGNIGTSGTNADILSDGSVLPSIVSGFEVTSGKDVVSSYIAISTGTLINHFGEQKSLGINTAGSIVGWLLRPSSVASTYNVCIDVFGGVYIERTSSPASTKKNGKIIVAKFTLDVDLNVTNLVIINNVRRGTVFNEAENKIVYVTEVPTDENFIRGDIAINKNPIETGVVGSRYVVDRWVKLVNWYESRIPTGN